MLGIKFIKVDPTIYLLQYQKGKLIREGSGLSFFYYAPTTSLVAVPAASTDIPFIFAEVTSDYQEVTIQGQVTFRVADPRRLSEMLNFTLDAKGQNYVSDDPEKFHQRIINRIQVLVRNEFQRLSVREVLRASDDLVHNVREALANSEALTSLGVEVLDLSILAIKPNPEMARALETEVREKLLEEADEAIYARRNAAVEQERAIKENELNTEIAVENKQRQIKEAKMDAERAVQEKRRLIKEEEMAGKISLEKKNKELVKLTVENAKVESDAKGYSLSVVMDAIATIDPKVLNSLASIGMEPNQLIALSFRELAESAAKIGELNVSPDLLREISKRSGRQHATSNRQ
jgi:regulator of protease activity HflC (stomatin/prohibitin superfamily)